MRRSTGRRMRLDNASVTATAARPAISAPNEDRAVDGRQKRDVRSLRAGRGVEIERAHERPLGDERGRGGRPFRIDGLADQLVLGIGDDLAIPVGDDDPLAAHLGQLRDLGLDAVPALGSVVGPGQEEGEASVVQWVASFHVALELARGPAAGHEGRDANGDEHHQDGGHQKPEAQATPHGDPRIGSPHPAPWRRSAAGPAPARSCGAGS